MTALAIVACLIALAGIVALDWLHQRERAQWAEERRELVNRAIARHAGEVRALDNRPRPTVHDDDTPVNPPIVGLS